MSDWSQMICEQSRIMMIIVGTIVWSDDVDRYGDRHKCCIPVMLHHRVFTFLLYLFSREPWITMRPQFSCCFSHFLVTKVHSWDSFELFSCSLLRLYFKWRPAHSLSLVEYIFKPVLIISKKKYFSFLQLSTKLNSNFLMTWLWDVTNVIGERWTKL